jgi:ubiquinone/menaquinone biosynthesis C-methylase UbiE
MGVCGEARTVEGQAEYENYDKTSEVYDNMRRCVGLESLESAMQMASDRLKKPVSELVVLDVGCGTGNYLKWISDKVGECVGVEFN